MFIKPILILAAVLAVAPAAGGAPGKPALRISDSKPLTLGGANFRAGERVLVRADLGDDTSFRKATAGLTGRFTVTFPHIELSRCGPDLSVVATGSLGSRFAFTLHHADCLR